MLNPLRLDPKLLADGDISGLLVYGAALALCHLLVRGSSGFLSREKGTVVCFVRLPSFSLSPSHVTVFRSPAFFWLGLPPGWKSALWRYPRLFCHRFGWFVLDSELHVRRRGEHRTQPSEQPRGLLFDAAGGVCRAVHSHARKVRRESDPLMCCLLRYANATNQQQINKSVVKCCAGIL